MGKTLYRKTFLCYKVLYFVMSYLNQRRERKSSNKFCVKGHFRNKPLKYLIVIFNESIKHNNILSVISYVEYRVYINKTQNSSFSINATNVNEYFRMCMQISKNRFIALHLFAIFITHAQ